MVLGAGVVDVTRGKSGCLMEHRDCVDIFAHFIGSVLTAFLIMNTWPYWQYWWIFAFTR